MTTLLILLSLALPQGRDLFGVSIALADDVNGDGVRELWVGDLSDDGYGEQGALGRVWLICPRSRRALLRIPAPERAERFGWTLTTLDDVDGDGRDELAVSAQWVAPPSQAERPSREHCPPTGAGCVYLFSGVSGTLLRSWSGPADGHRAWWHSYGAGPALASVGDWNGDGKGDLAIGWSRATDREPAQGCVRVVSGGEGALLHESWGADAYDHFGSALTMIGRSSSLEAGRLAVSAWPTCPPRTKHDRVKHGERPGYVRAINSSGELLFEARSPDDCQQFGFSLASIPGEGEEAGILAVGQCFNCSHEPAIHLLDAATGKRVRGIGRPRMREWDHVCANGYPDPETALVEPSFGACMLPLDASSADGFTRLLVTAPSALDDHHPAALMSTATGAVLDRVLLHTRPGKEPERVHWASYVGIVAAPAGDQDQDGVADFAIGGGSVRCSAEDCTGVVVICSGRDATPIRWLTRYDLEPD